MDKIRQPDSAGDIAAHLNKKPNVQHSEEQTKSEALGQEYTDKEDKDLESTPNQNPADIVIDIDSTLSSFIYHLGSHHKRNRAKYIKNKNGNKIYF